MLESPINQAAGLQGLVQPSGPRIMAMVSHGDESAELPLLWRLCWTLADLGYTVTVLDATTFESESNPGLDQLLENPYWQNEAGAEPPAWTVVPSGKAIQNLCHPPTNQAQNLRRLGQLFARDSVVILYSRAEWLVPMIGHCGVTPLLAVSPIKASLLTSYRALKRLLINGQLEPTIVNMVPPSTGLTNPSAGASSLVECARNFLNYDARAINLPATEEHASGAMQRLALRLMEGAVSLDTDTATMEQLLASKHLTGMDRFAGSH